VSAGAPPQLSEEDLLVPAVRPTFGRRLRSASRKYLSAVALTVALLVAWELIVRLGHVPEYLLPAPTQILADLKTDWVILWPAMLVTLKEVLIGFVIATVAGVGLAVVLHLYGPLRRAMYPILIGSQTIPIVVLAPILVILLGYGILPKLVIVALICFFPIVVNGIDGLRSVDAELILMMRTLDASRWAILRRVEFPAALPSIFSGLRIAATFAAIGAVFGEWSGASQGLGYVMLAATPNLLTARIFAAIVLLTAVALVLFGVVSLLERIFVPWAPRGGSERKDPR
jgi:putative hydroxymethylpyrimidine transport system permease protein